MNNEDSKSSNSSYHSSDNFHNENSRTVSVHSRTEESDLASPQLLQEEDSNEEPLEQYWLR